MFARFRGLVAGLLVSLSLSAVAIGGEPPRTPRFDGEGTFTLECRGTTTANGGTSADTRTYTVDAKRCLVGAWTASQCNCTGDMIVCNNQDKSDPVGLIINRTTTQIVDYRKRADWKFEGRCKRLSR